MEVKYFLFSAGGKKGTHGGSTALYRYRRFKALSWSHIKQLEKLYRIPTSEVARRGYTMLVASMKLQQKSSS